MQNRNPIVTLYLEYYHFLGGFLYKKVGTGLLSSYKNQKKILANLHVSYTETWNSGCDILQINTPWLFSLLLIKRAKAHNKKVIIWAHVTAEDIKGVFRFASVVSPLAKTYLTYAYGLADIILAPSAYTKSLLLAYGLPAEKIVVMSNGVDTDTFRFDVTKRTTTRALYNLNRVTVGIVGLAIKRKGIDTFLAMARAFPDCQFVWFGKVYSTLIAEGVPKDVPPNVQFTGYVDDIVGAFSALDIFLFPSYEENQGMSILEAGAVGLPALVRDIPVYKGFLEDGVNASVAKTTDEFQSKLALLIATAELRTRLGGALHDVVAKEHALTAIGEKTLALYTSLI